MNLEDIKLYLPKYLSTESSSAIIEALQDFPKIPPDRFYTQAHKDSPTIFQGDGLNELIIIDLPNTAIKSGKGIVLSNTCDISQENRRWIQARLLYATILDLAVYTTFLKDKGIEDTRISNHVQSIKDQYITQIFYLPGLAGVINESIVFLDRILNLPSSHIKPEEVTAKRIFTLSDYGHFLFLFKLSFHFTRFQDKVDRGYIK